MGMIPLQNEYAPYGMKTEDYIEKSGLSTPIIPNSPFTQQREWLDSNRDGAYKAAREKNITAIAQTANKYKEALMEIRASVELAMGDEEIRKVLYTIIDNTLDEAGF